MAFLKFARLNDRLEDDDKIYRIVSYCIPGCPEVIPFVGLSTNLRGFVHGDETAAHHVTILQSSFRRTTAILARIT